MGTKDTKHQNSYHCPRCKSLDIHEYDDFIECFQCRLDFDKVLFGKVPDGEMLARQEMGGIFDAFEELKDPEKVKKIFNSIIDDLKDES